MKHLGMTIFSGIIFLVAAFVAGLLPISAGGVSQETGLLERYRETFSVKQGVSQDGQLVISRVSDAPTIPPRMKSYNHERTLRVFIAPDRGGAAVLYLERVKPHEYYQLSGSFMLAQSYTALAWISATTFEFYGVSSTGKLMRHRADVHALTLAVEPLDEGAVSPESTPAFDILL